MDKVAIAGDEHVRLDVGIEVTEVDAVGGQLHVDAVLPDGRQTVLVALVNPAGDVNRLYARSVEPARIVCEGVVLEVSVCPGDYHSSKTLGLFADRADVGYEVALLESKSDVFPIEKQGYFTLFFVLLHSISPIMFIISNNSFVSGQSRCELHNSRCREGQEKANSVPASSSRARRYT